MSLVALSLSFESDVIRLWNLLPFNLQTLKYMDAFNQSLTAAVV